MYGIKHLGDRLQSNVEQECKSVKGAGVQECGRASEFGIDQNGAREYEVAKGEVRRTDCP